MDRAIGVINWRSIFRATSCPACVKLWLAVAQIIAVPSRLWWNWWNRLSAPSGSRCVGGNLVKLAVWRACVPKFRQRSGLHDVFCFWNTFCEVLVFMQNCEWYSSCYHSCWVLTRKFRGSFYPEFAHNSLPTRSKIQARGMETDTRCPMYCRCDEDGGHLLLNANMCGHGQYWWSW